MCFFPYGDTREAYEAVYTVPAPGGPAREVISGGSNPLFSADGRYIASLYRMGAYAPQGVAVVAVDCATPATYDLASGPSWSPTGHRLAFVWGIRGVTVVNASRPRHTWSVRNGNTGPLSWSPRGNVLAFFRPGARPGIYLVQPPARRVRRQVDLGEAADVKWSPNGRWLALQGGESVYLVRNDGRFLAVVGRATPALAWSPDSSRVAWVDGGYGGIVVTKPRDEGVAVGNRAEVVSAFTWSHDSKRIIFASASH